MDVRPYLDEGAIAGRDSLRAVGRVVAGTTVLCRSDNAAVVAIVNTGRSKNDLATQLMRSLFFFFGQAQLRVYATHS